MKLGQVLSTRTDLLPQEFLTELALLQQRVPAAEWTDVRHLLETELGDTIDNFFASFDEIPLRRVPDSSAQLRRRNTEISLVEEAARDRVETPSANV
ncbi:hypothetical protein GCM10022381_33590 [Leifsonia kafniensis]|uniref:ABC1 atypical kinase-like domain-containing protein n=1 Tax=Leifsonia kafniensis TaxID=475957 RepID=A0ABP7KYM5_9MICO